MRKTPLLNFLYSLILVAVTALWCSYFSNWAMENFYGYLRLPDLTPPNYVFPIAWTIIYTLMIISFDFILNSEFSQKTKICINLYIANLLLQVLWSYIFFYNGWFLLGFAVIVILDFVVIVMIEQFHYINKTAAYLLIPYLVWISYATYLNWGIADLNGPSYIF